MTKCDVPRIVCNDDNNNSNNNNYEFVVRKFHA